MTCGGFDSRHGSTRSRTSTCGTCRSQRVRSSSGGCQAAPPRNLMPVTGAGQGRRFMRDLAVDAGDADRARTPRPSRMAPRDPLRRCCSPASSMAAAGTEVAGSPTCRCPRAGPSRRPSCLVSRCRLSQDKVRSQRSTGTGDLVALGRRSPVAMCSGQPFPCRSGNERRRAAAASASGDGGFRLLACSSPRSIGPAALRRHREPRNGGTRGSSRWLTKLCPSSPLGSVGVRRDPG